MKKSNIIILFACLLFFGVLSSFQFFSIIRLSSKCDNFKRKIEYDYFISESFRNACEAGNYSALIEWQKMCRNVCQLDYIGWGEAADFLATDKLDDGKNKLMYGKWISSFGEGEVYCRIK